MNRLSILIFVFTYSAVVHAGSISSVDQALELLKSEVLQTDFNDKIIWKAKARSQQGDIVNGLYGGVMTAPAEGWFFFIDDLPGASWQHACRYVFVTVTGEINIHSSNHPPRESEFFDAVHTRMYQRICLAENRRPARKGSPYPTDPHTGEKYAVLVSGGISQAQNYPRYWNDLSDIYCTLVYKYGFEDDHIYVLCSDGLDPAPDQSNYLNSDPDLDGDSDEDITGPAKLESIRAVIDTLAQVMTEEDLFVYFQTDHGGFMRTYNSFANLWFGELLLDTTLANIVSVLPECEQIYTFEQCCGGGFEDDLMDSGTPKRIFNSASLGEQPSMGLPPLYEYDAFVFYWTAALRGYDAYGNPADADYNNDQFISLREAFHYADIHDFCPENPQYNANPGLFGNYKTLDWLIEFSQVSLSGIFLDDDSTGSSSGNGDRCLNPDETVELSVEVRNIGTLSFGEFSGILECTDPNVEIIDDECSFPSLPFLGFTSSESDPFLIHVSSLCPAGHEIAFNTTIEDTAGNSFLLSFSLTCQGNFIDAEKEISAVNSAEIRLSASPNPFNHQSVISFTLEQSADVSLKVFDITGREVQSLVNGHLSPGAHQAVFDAKNLSSGFYFIKLEYLGETTMIKSLLVK